jgi:shikimate kinase
VVGRVLVTGISGAGKSTLLDGLARRGHRVVDTDYDGWVGDDGRWDVRRMTDLLQREPRIVVAGTVDNQGDFYDRFDHIVLLSAPLDVLLERVASRTTNPYGRDEAEQAEIARYVHTVEPLLRRSATVELDGLAEPSELVSAVEGLLVPEPRRPPAATAPDSRSGD